MVALMQRRQRIRAHCALLELVIANLAFASAP